MAAVGMFAAFNASATLTISLTTTQPALFISDKNYESGAEIAATLGLSGGQFGTLLFDSGGQGTGLLQNSYSANPSGSQVTPPVDITYVSGGIANATYLYVKDGDEGAYVFNLGSTGANPLYWNGTDEIQIDELFKSGKTFSDVEIYGNIGGILMESPIPEPSTIFAAALLLLPFGAGVLRSYRKQPAD